VGSCGAAGSVGALETLEPNADGGVWGAAVVLIVHRDAEPHGVPIAKFVVETNPVAVPLQTRVRDEVRPVALADAGRDKPTIEDVLQRLVEVVCMLDRCTALYHLNLDGVALFEEVGILHVAAGVEVFRIRPIRRVILPCVVAASVNRHSKLPLHGPGATSRAPNRGGRPALHGPEAQQTRCNEGNGAGGAPHRDLLDSR